MRPHALLALASIVTAPSGRALAAPTLQDTPQAVVVTGAAYQLRLFKDRGVFDFLVDPEGDDTFVSVMRPGGELGWYGYNTPTGGASTGSVVPQIEVRRGPAGPVISVRCVLDEAHGVTHRAQYACRDEGVIICSRYECATPGLSLDLVRTGPKLDVDINLLTHYLFRDRGGERHTGTLTDQERVFYCGARAWGGPDSVEDFARAQPYQMLYSPETHAKLAVLYAFFADIWQRQSKFLQLYSDGGNYWYTGTGAGSAIGRDYVVCLYTDGALDESRLEQNLDHLLQAADTAVAQGEIEAVIQRRPRAGDGPLYLLSYDHAVGYPKIQDEARKSVGFLDQYPDLKIGLQAEGWTWDWLAKNDPAFVAEARGWITKYPGRWVPGGGSYGQPYFTFISEESGFRQMLYGTRAIKQHLGYDNTIYIYSEHETMPQLPQVLAGMGYRGAFFRTHMGYGGDGPSLDADWVRWIGPDGSAIPAVPAYTGREHGWGNEWLIINYRPGIYWNGGPACTWEDVEDFKVEMLARGVQHPIISRCEDWYTRPSRELLDDVQAHATQNTQWVTAEDYFGILEASGIKPVDFAAGPNDFAPQQPWGYAGNRTWTGPRQASSAAVAAEALAAAAIRHGSAWTPEHQQRLDEAWKNLLIAEHHDSLICAIYNEGRDFTDPSLQLSRDLGHEAAGYLASQIGVQGRAVLVFNPTGHPRTEAVHLAGVPDVQRVVGPDGEAVPSQRAGDDLWFTAREVPGLGYSAFRLETGGPPASAPAGRPGNLTLTTDRYDLAFGAEGGLVRLHDRTTGHDLIAEGPTGFLDGVIGSERLRSTGTVAGTLNGPCVWQAVETGHIGAVAYEATYTLAAGSPRVDLHVRLDIPPGTRIGCPEDQGTPEARRGGQFRDHSVKLRYVLNTALGATAQAVRHQPLIIQEMPPRSETVDANLWASLETESAGLAVANRGSMGYRALGSTLELILAYSGEYVWGDKFLEGTYDYDFALIPYDGPAARASAHRQAIEFDRPLLALPFEGAGGALPLTASVVDLGRLPDAVTALALFPQDGRLFLRLCNMSADPVRVRLPARTRAADLALHVGDDVRGEVTLHPWRGQTYEVGG